MMIIDIYRGVAERALPYRRILLAFSIGALIASVITIVTINGLFPNIGFNTALIMYVAAPSAVWSWGCVLTIAWFGSDSKLELEVRSSLYSFGLVIAALFLSVWMLAPFMILTMLIF